MEDNFAVFWGILWGIILLGLRRQWKNVEREGWMMKTAVGTPESKSK